MKKLSKKILVISLSFFLFIIACSCHHDRTDSKTNDSTTPPGYQFANPIIGNQVREELGKGVNEPVLQVELDSIKTVQYYSNDLHDLDIADLAQLKNLEELRLENCRIQNIDALTNLTHLVELDLRSCDFAGLPPLANNHQLREVSLVYATGIHDLNGLLGCKNLRELNITFTDISDISALAEMPFLRLFYARETLVSDVSALRQCFELEEVMLRASPVEDISPLMQLTELERIDLTNTRLASRWFVKGDVKAKAQYDKLAQTLPGCEIEWYVSDMP